MDDCSAIKNKNEKKNKKKNEVLPFVTTWMDSEGIMLGEISQTEKEKYCMIILIWEYKN